MAKSIDRLQMVRKKKNPEYIQVMCKPKKFDFSNIFFDKDKNVETYLKRIIKKHLSQRQQLLINYLYYEMLSVDEVISSLIFRDNTALNKEKYRALKIIKIQIIKDYDYIGNEYSGTFLWYWAKQIKRKFDGLYAKNYKKVLSI